MSVKRDDLVLYLEANGYGLLREGGNHSTFPKGIRCIPVNRHRVFDRMTANEICMQAGLGKKF